MSSAKPPFWVDMVAGTCGGMAMVVTGHPFETIKARMQLDFNNSYKGTLDCTRQVIKKSGMWGLWRGMGAPIMATGMLNMVLFTTSGFMKKIVHRDHSRPITTREVIYSSLLTAPVYVTFLSPVEVIKIRMQTNLKHAGPIACLRECIREEGPFGLVRGWTAALGMRLIGLPVYFGGYQFFKQTLAECQITQSHDVAIQLLSGGGAGMCFWMANYPLDLIKTYNQASAERSVWKSIGQIYAKNNHSIAGFWKGFLPCLMRAAPANAVCFMTVEQVTNLIFHKT